jgi:predicted secreted protein
MSDAFMSGITVKRGDGGGPDVFTAIPEVISLSGMGKTNSLVDVTNFDSAGAKEYIAGLADGTEITVEANYLPADTQQQALIADVDAGLTRNIQVITDDGTTETTYDFAVVALSWVLNPSNDDRNTISFGLKITGAITAVTV